MLRKSSTGTVKQPRGDRHARFVKVAEATDEQLTKEVKRLLFRFAEVVGEMDRRLSRPGR